MTSTPLDTKAISKLAEILDKNNLTEIEYEDEGSRICIKRETFTASPMAYAQAPIHAQAAPVSVQTAQQIAAPATASQTDISEDFSKHPGAVKSPLVGVIYLSPEPGAAAYVKIGDTVNVGDTLCLIEAMKTYNPIKAQKAGKVSKILAQNGAPVEYGEPLIIIE